MAGRYRTHDDGHPECVIDGQGELPGHGTFSGPAELGELLLQPGLVDACSVRQYVTFAIGRRPNSAEQALVDARVAAFRSGGHDFAELVASFVESPEFGLVKEPAP
jgi:hypothetical protein